jgi:hypothetical protein
MPQGKEGALPTHGAKTLPSVVVDSYTKRWSLCTTMRWCKAERTAVSPGRYSPSGRTQRRQRKISKPRKRRIETLLTFRRQEPVGYACEFRAYKGGGP